MLTFNEYKVKNIFKIFSNTGCIDKKPEFGRFFHVFRLENFFQKILKMTHIRVILCGKSIARILQANVSQILIQKDKCVYIKAKNTNLHTYFPESGNYFQALGMHAIDFPHKITSILARIRAYKRGSGPYISTGNKYTHHDAATGEDEHLRTRHLRTVF
jgi:hypothetical protein